ncbi:MAG: Hsp33 family molecular chaperone HslO [Rhodospirillales bacterium]|nr:Hsp33 family molecular chaperone HslO [Rhodospirillales bacterium]
MTDDDGMLPPLTVDCVQPFQIEATGVRGRLVRLGATLEGVLAGHAYPPAVAAMLAEALAMAAVLSSSLKYDGIFTLQLEGDGPVGLMVVDYTSSGHVRGYARFDAERLAAEAPAANASVPQLFGAARMSFTVDQGPDTARYQGITPLEGATLAACCHAYFRQSEQLQTAIMLCASDMARAEEPRRAGALMIQRLPIANPLQSDAAEDDWRRAVAMMSSATASELLSPALAADSLLYRLFNEDGVRVYRQRPLAYRCRCSQAKVERTLAAFPLAELMAMAENGVLQVTCEFCKANYVMDEAALRAVGSR